MAVTLTGLSKMTGLGFSVGYTANSVVFGGDDYLLLSSAIGGADSATSLVSMWFKVDDAGGDGNLMVITDTTDGHFRVSRNASDEIEINLENAADMDLAAVHSATQIDANDLLTIKEMAKNELMYDDELNKFLDEE